MNNKQVKRFRKQARLTATSTNNLAENPKVHRIAHPRYPDGVLYAQRMLDKNSVKSITKRLKREFKS